MEFWHKTILKMEAHIIYAMIPPPPQNATLQDSIYDSSCVMTRAATIWEFFEVLEKEILLRKRQQEAINGCKGWKY